MSSYSSRTHPNHDI